MIAARLSEAAHIEGAKESEDDGDYVHNGSHGTDGVKHHLELAHGAHQKGGAAQRHQEKGRRFVQLEE